MGVLGIADCDACCSEPIRADGRKAYCGGAEGADWAAEAGIQRYSISAVVFFGACDLSFIVFLLREMAIFGCRGGLRSWLICGIADCDACCRERIRADGRRAYCGGAEGADWAAEAGSQRYVLYMQLLL
jgi:hypothetical protein